ncbi:MAG: rhodanese-like domain-containing protein [Treponema sp.]
MKMNVFLASAVLLASCAMSAGAENAKKITAEQGKKMVGGKEKIVLVDVRRLDEYEAGHIASAILIPNESISNKKPVELPDLNAKIIVYCRSGRRSANAAEKLVAMGYANVFDMGGIIDWPYGVVKGSTPGDFK